MFLPFFIFPIGIALLFMMVGGGCRRSAGRRALCIVAIALGAVWLVGQSRHRALTVAQQSWMPTAPTAYVVHTSGPATQTAQLWIDDWNAFVNSSHFSGFRAESTDVCPTEQESRAEAAGNAVDILMQRVSNDPRVDQALARLNGSREMIKQRLASAIQSGSLVEGQYIHTTEKPYGTLYKTYLLIDTSAEKLNPLIQQLNRQIVAQRRQTLTAAGSIAATVLVVLLLYAFLNTVTKGYFIWRLRAAVILALIAGVLIFCSIV